MGGVGLHFAPNLLISKIGLWGLVQLPLGKQGVAGFIQQEDHMNNKADYGYVTCATPGGSGFVSSGGSQPTGG